MNELSGRMKTVFRVMIALLLGCALVWILAPNAREWAAGLFLGAVFSSINALMLSMKIHLIAHQAMQGTTRRVHAGFVSRACMCIIAVMIAYKLPQFELIATIAGLFTAQIAAYVIGLAHLWKRNGTID